MATLTEISVILRKGILFGSIGFVVLIIATLSLMSYAANNTPSVVVPTPAPSASFGTLPPIVFPSSSPRPSSFDLQLIEGKPPEATSSAPIYFIPEKKPSLFSKRQGITLARQLRFLEEPIERTETILDFTNSQTQDTLTVDIGFNNFLLKRNVSDMSALQEPLPADEREIENIAERYFKDLRTWDDNLSIPTISYYSLEGQTPRKLPDSRNAMLARVDFFQPSVAGYPVVTAKYLDSDVYVLFSADAGKVSMDIEASYQLYPADLSYFGTYPTISGEEAWEQLTTGKGYIASPVLSSRAIVRRVYLAYYQPHMYQPYLQLVWVFTGDDNFAAYVPAIHPEWIGE